MGVIVRVPAVLRKITGGNETVSADGGSIAEIIESVEGKYPGVKAKLYDEGGALRRFINIYLNGEDIRFLAGLETAVADGGEVSIVPAIAGG